jgi:6-phosphogluconate dehydrogenase
MRRHASLRMRGIHLVDAGTSGGIWGLENGFSLMIGGEEAVVGRLRPLFEALAPSADRGWGHVGPPGAGHFVKMIHNGIEYGLMAAYAEGFEILESKQEFGIDVHQVAEIWRHGSVVRSWLLDLAAGVLLDNPALEGIKGRVPDSGEGRWTVKECIDSGLPAPVITMALMARFASQHDGGYAARLLAALRGAFGGHAVERAESGGN